MLFPFSGLAARHRTLFNPSLQYEERTHEDGSGGKALNTLRRTHVCGKRFPVWRENSRLKKVCFRVFKVLGGLGVVGSLSFGPAKFVSLIDAVMSHVDQTNFQKRVCVEYGLGHQTLQYSAFLEQAV